AERADPLDDIGAVDVGQTQIEQDQVRRHLRRAQHPFLTGAHGRDLVPVRLEAGTERAPDLRFVVDDQHLHADPTFTGSSNTTTVPPPGAPSIQMRPPCATTTACAMASPRPLPGRSGAASPR